MYIAAIIYIFAHTTYRSRRQAASAPTAGNGDKKEYDEYFSMDGAAGVLLHLHGMRRQRRYAGARTEHRTGGGHLEVEELDGRSAKPRRHELYLLRRVYVYVELHEDNTYALYQNVSAVGAVKFTGSYSLEASTIRGFYSTSAGSKAWSDSYEIGNLSGSAMTWTASHAAGDVQQFVRVETVPQEVLDASAEVRSAAVPTSGGIW